MLAGATLLVFANKQDLPGALTAEEIKDVSFFFFFCNISLVVILPTSTFLKIIHNTV
jgi:signal recognition particle receptor subunit beta